MLLIQKTEISMSKRIIISGATGLIGSRLASELASSGFEITIFTRNINKSRMMVPTAKNYVEWDYRRPEKWEDHLEGANAVIHLAGASIAGKRFTDSYKKKVRGSRIISTRNIVKAIAEIKDKPKAFICASGINYYGDSGDRKLTESSGAGNDFLADVCKEWEDEAAEAEKFGVRRVCVRTSPVMSTVGGMVKTLLPLFRFYLGASLGSGSQWFSWIHIDDIIKLYKFAVENESVSGAVNASSPNPVRMDEFADYLGETLHKPVFLKVPKFAMKAAIGEAADFITASLRVLPERVQNTGFSFDFPYLPDALKDIIRNKK